MPMSDRNKELNEVGKSYYSYVVIQLAATTTEKFLFSTNGAEVDITSIIVIGRAGDAAIRIYEAPTVTDPGTPLPVQSFNRKDNRAGLAVLSNSTVTTSNSGTEIDSVVVFGPGGSNVADVNSQPLTDEGVEWIIPKNTQYLIEVENLDGTASIDFNFKMKWNELNT